jgi:light-regulated signal transduction histidine kinase (bacteriophytochrome)
MALSLVETVRQPLLVLDTSLKVVAANSAFYQTFHSAPADVLNRPLCQLGDGQWDISRLRALLEEIIATNGHFEGFEAERDFPTVGPRIMLLNARKIAQDGAGLVLLAIEDVTGSVHARREMLRLNEDLEARVRQRTAQLEASNRELEAFCYSVSHDLRAPLRALDGFSDELLRSYSAGLDDRGQHYLRRIREATQRMGGLIDDLLQLSRLARVEMARQRVGLSEIAQAIAAELQQSGPTRRVEFVIQLGLTAFGDPGLLRIVLANLLANAWKFTSRRDAARIEFGRVGTGRAAFFVRDNGAGFDMAHVDKLFGAFQRLHPEREFPGHGIGLATVQRVVHRHGGEAWAESTPNHGATFFFTLQEGAEP